MNSWPLHEPAALPPASTNRIGREGTTSSWHPVDLEAARSTEPIRATLLRGVDVALLYPGMRHLLSGAPECMKTWAAAIAALEAIRAGGAVVWINTDGMPVRDLLARFDALGLDACTCDRLLSVVDPHDPPTHEDIATLVALRPALVVLDSIEPAGAMLHTDTNTSAGVETLLRTLVDPFHRSGATTLLLDHVTKDPDARGRYSIGSQRKLAAVDVHLGLKVNGAPLTRNGGRCEVTITVHKDRAGSLRRNHHHNGGRLTFTATADGCVDWHLAGPAANDTADEADTFRPTTLMEKVSRHLEIAGTDTLSGIERARLGRAEYVRQAVAILVRDQYISVEAGPRRSRQHTSLRPYRADTDPTPSHPVPTPSVDRVNDPVPRPTPYTGGRGRDDQTQHHPVHTPPTTAEERTAKPNGQSPTHVGHVNGDQPQGTAPSARQGAAAGSGFGGNDARPEFDG